MTHPTTLNDEANSTNDCADAETAQPSIDLPALLRSLTMAQRNSRACIVCGGSDYPLKPVGKIGNTPVVECDMHAFQRERAADSPAWLTACPAWCIEDHHGADHPDDRVHWSAYRSTPAHTMQYEDCGSPNEPGHMAHSASLVLVQHYREAEPRVSLSDNANDKWSLQMTLAEAEQVARHILDIIHTAREGGTK
ncbi:DUF6907 domain-containing protein [Nonomuraea sp. NPDC050790]|uniref:DUF6907 domain-containing protein n=1 Tax=Nonomuraea sp. NPDC050790 TaxID=3364371 RepID=UPI00379BCF7C